MVKLRVLLLWKVIVFCVVAAREFYDPDCKREDPFWQKYLSLVSAQAAAGQRPDFHVSRYALQIPGCPLGKIVACMAAETLARPSECLHHISSDFYLLISSSWPVLWLLDHEQQQIWKNGELQSDFNEDDCIVSLHDSWDWNNFRGALEHAVDETHGWISKSYKGQVDFGPLNTQTPVGNLTYLLAESSQRFQRVERGEHVEKLEDSQNLEDGQGGVEETFSVVPVSVLMEECPFGELTMYILDGIQTVRMNTDANRALEKIFGKLEDIWHRKFQVMWSRWRLFGLLQALVNMKRISLDLSEAVLTTDLDKPPSYLMSGNPWDWEVGDLSHCSRVEHTAGSGGAGCEHVNAQRDAAEIKINPVNTQEDRRALSLQGVKHGGQMTAGDDVEPDLHALHDAAALNGGKAVADSAISSQEMQEFEADGSSGANGAQSSQKQAPPQEEGSPMIVSKPADNNEVAWRLSKIVRNNKILLTTINDGGLVFLKNWLRRSKYFITQGGLGVVLTEVYDDLQCRSIASSQLSKLDHKMEKYMCLPFLSSSSWFLSVLGYMRVGVLAGYDMAYVSISNFWVRNPFPYLWRSDINVQTESEDKHKIRSSLFAVKGNDRSLTFLTDLLITIYTFPFTDVKKAMSDLVFGGTIVPRVSYGQRSAPHHLWWTHFYDVESRFVSTDGWLGRNPEKMILFDLRMGDRRDPDVTAEFEKMYDTLHAGEVSKEEFPIRLSRTGLSPRRPLWKSLIHDSSCHTACETAGQKAFMENLEGPRSSVQSFRDSFHVSEGEVFIVDALWNETHQDLMMSNSIVVNSNIMSDRTKQTTRRDEWNILWGVYLDGVVGTIGNIMFHDVGIAQNVCLQLGPQFCGGITCKTEGFTDCYLRDGKIFLIDDYNRSAEDGRPGVKSSRRKLQNSDIEVVISSEFRQQFESEKGGNPFKLLKKIDPKTFLSTLDERPTKVVEMSSCNVYDPVVAEVPQPKKKSKKSKPKKQAVTMNGNLERNASAEVLVSSSSLNTGCTAKAEPFQNEQGSVHSSLSTTSSLSTKKQWIRYLPVSETAEITLLPPGMALMTNERIFMVKYDVGGSSIPPPPAEDDENPTELPTSEQAVQKGRVDVCYELKPADLFTETASTVEAKKNLRALVFQRSLELIPDNDILIFADSNVGVKSDIRYILARYLRGSDVAAIGIPKSVPEGRAQELAFTSAQNITSFGLDAHTLGVMRRTLDQVIIVRKTPLSLRFAKDWSKASFKKKISPATSFSLLFKKYGFLAIETSHADEVFSEPIIAQ